MCANDDHTFWPLTTYTSPLRSARVRADVRLEAGGAARPECGLLPRGREAQGCRPYGTAGVAKKKGARVHPAPRYEGAGAGTRSGAFTMSRRRAGSTVTTATVIAIP